MIRLSRTAITVFTLAFGLYHGILGLLNLDHYDQPNFVLIATAGYFIVLIVAISDFPGLRLKDHKAAFTLVIALLISPFMAAATSPEYVDSHATWHIAGIATLMAIIALRQHIVMAWFGVIVMTAQVLIWGGFERIFSAGIFGAVMLVAAAHAGANTLNSTSKAAIDFRDKALATAAETAANTAARAERKLRVEKALAAALPMLKEIEQLDGKLSSSQKLKALQLEETLRDQIRGRSFDSPELVLEISKARARGVEVQVLDDGGLDQLGQAERNELLAEVARQVARVESGKLVLRSVADEKWVVSVIASKPGSEIPDLFIRL